ISYPISITNNANPYAGNQVRVFIDWNQNQVFDVGTSEEIILTANVGNTVYSGTVHVPNDALAGETRMRVRQSWNQVPSPCGQQNYGEIEDYAVVVTFPVCPPPLNVMTSNLTTTSVDINFDSVLGDVFVEYGIPPFSPGTDANAGGGLIEGPATS